MQQLKQILHRIDGKGYKAYKEIQGMSFSFPLFQLTFCYVQGDPFASPSQLTLEVPQKTAAFPAGLYSSRIRKVALEDFVTRTLSDGIKSLPWKISGAGKSGTFIVDSPCQEVLERSSVSVNGNSLQVRLFAGLPAAGRRILGKKALEMFCRALPTLVEASLLFKNQPQEALVNHINTVEGQDNLRRQLPEKDLVAFIADGSILPRRSGVDKRPLDSGQAVFFNSPASMAVELNCPHRGTVRGMGIPCGVTLIAGGGFHGKSTLLRALERGVYNHIPGDGREGVVTHPFALKIRAEDGRRVEKVNITPFINNLPDKSDTASFTTEEASGSTSQAANIIEGLEAGAKLLLIDEDTSATNFMIRDRRMQMLIAGDKEPITPFIFQVAPLSRMGISTILVAGGSGDYFDVADTVIAMEAYQPREVTARAREIARRYNGTNLIESPVLWNEIRERSPLPESINFPKGRRVKIKARGKDTLQFGGEEIDLRHVEQIAEQSQIRAIGDLLLFALDKRILDGKQTLRQVIEKLNQFIHVQGLAAISPYPGRPRGDYARPRTLEVAAAINRLRTLRVK